MSFPSLNQKAKDVEVVVSGMSGKFPRCNNVNEYLDSLLNKIHLCDENVRKSFLQNSEVIKIGGRINNFEKCDIGFFGIHDFESVYMNPATRLLLEQVIQALFDAGIHPDELKGTKTGVFLGAVGSEYEVFFRDLRSGNTNMISGTIKSMMTNRVSYFLQLNGPSICCDSACSSSMYALDEAYKSILSGTCDRAIVGGTNLTLNPFLTIQFGRMGVLNNGSGCRPFDNDGSGYTRSEAIVAIILQKNTEAKRIYGNLVHMKTNSDGYKLEGITFPSFDGQLELINDVFLEANVDPKKIGFLEAHGTGTKAGDPIELAVIDAFFKPTKEEPLLIGSVKGNIGHTEPSAALCSIVKTLAALNMGQIAPNIHYDTPRVGVTALEENRLQVVTELMPFPTNKSYAGVNSFGFGGANGLAIFKKYTKPKRIESSEQTGLRLVCYSGRSQAAIDAIHKQIHDCSDIEYLSLLQESFKLNFENHLYRGFTIVGSDLKSSSRSFQINPGKIIFILNHSNKADHFEDLIKVPLLKTAFEKVKNILDSLQKYNTDIAYQLMLIVALKELIPDIELFEIDKLSISMSSYLTDKISLKEFCSQFIIQNMNNLMLRQQIIEELIINNSKMGSICTVIVLGLNVNAFFNNLNKRCQIVNFGDNMTQQDFLRNIGSLYQFGYNPIVHKLYEEMKYPVSCGTNMLSHLLQWKQKFIRTVMYNSGDWFQPVREIQVWSGKGDKSFINGHIIDGRVLFPATGYLYNVWVLFAEKLGYQPHEMKLVFENVRFHRACNCGDKSIKLHFMLRNDGVFEVSENTALMVSGHIRLYDAKREDASTEFAIDENQNKSSYVLSNKDVYRELRLRGYNYSKLFRSIQEAGPNVATIKWNEEWISFLDNMMQVAILQNNTRNLMVPIGIERLVIRAGEHTDYVSTNENELVTVNYCETTKSINSKFVEMRGLSARSISKRKVRLQPVLESYQFVPNEYDTDLRTSIRINMQLLLENKGTLNFKVVEVLGSHQEPVITEICNVIEDLPLILPDMTIVTSNESFQMENFTVTQNLTEQNLLLVCQNPMEKLALETDKALIADGFLLCIEASEAFLKAVNDTFILLTRHLLEDQRTAYFFRKNTSAEKKTIICDVSDMKELKWVQEVQKAMQTNDDIVLFAHDNYKNGILGLTNCLIKEPGNQDKVRCVFVQDSGASLDLNNNRNSQQLRKQMTVNVFKNGQWGTYRHLSLQAVRPLTWKHCFAKALIPGDLQSVTWMEKPPPINNNAGYKVEYSSLNFRDMMLASGKLNPEAFTTDRFQLDFILGFEFSGYDKDGKRVMGIGGSCLTDVAYNPDCIVQVPDSWELKEAATIPVVYTTVLYALEKAANIQKGQSILIHSGTGGIGLGALNVCTHYECEIFVTVGTTEKRDYLLKNYPNIKATHIGNSRDISFKSMVLRETNGRGVDIVLNSLAEEKLRASVDCLAYGGVFLEIGKYDLVQNNDLQLDIAMKGCTHHAVMVDKMLSSPDKLEEIWQFLSKAIEKKYVKPLPTTIFQMNEVDKAFKHMSTGKHIGKVLIQIDHERERNVIPRFYCDPRRSYIIFGGLGGFGLELADWLVLRGAKNIYLSSRRGVTTGYQKCRIELWKSYGVNVFILKEDVANYKVCYNVLKNINETAPIDGIFNLAVVLQDAVFEHQNADTMISSMLPKAILTENLDTTTRKLALKLSYFVVFSSVSCGRGNAGQTNYGFSNSVMERICERRHADGLPALAVQWGAIGDVGILEEMQKENNEIAIGGTLQQKVLNCLEVLDRLILQDQPIVSSMVVAEKFSKGNANTPIEAVLQILSITDLKSVGMHMPLPEFGMDSLMAVEIKQLLENNFDIILEPNEIRNLTFAKLEDIATGNSEFQTNESSAEKAVLSKLPVKSSMGIVNFNNASQSQDFILAFPGIDGDIRHFELIANATKCNIKCICYDGISTALKSFDEVVSYAISELHEEIAMKLPFKIVAHSMGIFPALELIRKLEAKEISVTLIVVDSAPELLYRLYDNIQGQSKEELECNILVEIINALLPDENTNDLKNILSKKSGLNEKVEFVISHYISTSLGNKDHLKELMFSFMSRLSCVAEHRTLPLGNKIKSRVILYKPSLVSAEDLPEDYSLSTICENIDRIDTFEGNHTSILYNKTMQKKMMIDFKM